MNDSQKALPLGRAAPHRAFMVKSVEIKNFRGFEDFKADGFAPINLIVGDNAVGKTALLEAIFLTLCGDAGKALSLKTWRGLGIAFNPSSVDSVVQGIYADLFHDPKSKEPISIRLTGDGFQNRHLSIDRAPRDLFIPTKEVKDTRNRHQRRTATKKNRSAPDAGEMTTVPISLTWTDSGGAEHVSRAFLSSRGLKFEGTGEQIPLSQMHAAQIAVPSEEAAEQFADLERDRDEEKFVKIFLSIFDWIRKISVGSVGGSPVLQADVPWAKQMLPLPALSGGTNRAATILLGLTKCKGGTVLADEIESGIFHTRQAPFAKALIETARAYGSQLLMTSHSEEWISKFIDVVGQDAEDVAMWRMERIKHGPPQIRRFSIAEYKSGLALGDMR